MEDLEKSMVLAAHISIVCDALEESPGRYTEDELIGMACDGEHLARLADEALKALRSKEA
jgi:hypothetical protein